MAIDLEKIESSDYLLDLLIQCETVLDDLDLYAFSGWISGEVVAGPIVKRHWVGMSLLYPYHKMPDPRGCLRLLKHGVKVEFNHMHKNPGDSENEYSPAEEHSETTDDTYWLVELTFPRRLLADINGADLDMYDDEIEVDDVEEAKDEGLDDESAYQSDEQLSGSGSDQNGEAPNAPPR